MRGKTIYTVVRVLMKARRTGAVYFLVCVMCEAVIDEDATRCERQFVPLLTRSNARRTPMLAS